VGFNVLALLSCRLLAHVRGRTLIQSSTQSKLGCTQAAYGENRHHGNCAAVGILTTTCPGSGLPPPMVRQD
jgi:hypothetical protein